jgi:transposase
MFGPQWQVRIWLYARPADMRKSYDGLSALVKHALNEDPLFGGALYVFINRKRTQMKCLYFDGGGYCIWSKRLEAGVFHYRRDQGEKQVLDVSALRLLIEGIDISTVRRYKRYRHPLAGAAPL